MTDQKSDQPGGDGLLNPREYLKLKYMADTIIGEIENRFPNWRSYRDLIDCIDVTLHGLHSGLSFSPLGTGPAEPVAHYHQPSTMHMGDCSVCGNVSDHPLHIGSPSYATPPVRGDREAIAKVRTILAEYYTVDAEFDTMWQKVSEVLR